jgi:hypothetical protein
LEQVVESRFRFADRQRRMGRAVAASETDGELSALQRQALEAYREFVEITPATLSSSLEPWITLVEALRAAWGDCPAFDRIAILAAGIRSKDETGAPGGEEATIRLVDRFRFMRLKSGAPRWWNDRLRSEESSMERNKLLLLMWTWATPKTMLKISETLAKILDRLDKETWESLYQEYSTISSALMRGRESPAPLSEPELQKIKGQCLRFQVFVGSRLSGDDRFEIAKTMTGTISGDHALEAQFALDAILGAIRRSSDLKSALPLVKALYAGGASARGGPYREEQTMNDAIAKEISQFPDAYPLRLVAEADNRLRSIAGPKAAKLLDVAEREGWFR